MSAKELFETALMYDDSHNYREMNSFYLKSIELGHTGAMTNLGFFYQKNNDYENMKKYYLMAIEKNNSEAMFNLGLWYGENGDYENMKMYYLMAITPMEILFFLKNEISPVHNKY
jgi:TPR repeat protein